VLDAAEVDAMAAVQPPDHPPQAARLAIPRTPLIGREDELARSTLADRADREDALRRYVEHKEKSLDGLR
jgi:hypothetical protein